MPSFELPAQACLNETIEILDQSSGVSTREWSLCTTKFEQIPSYTKLLSNYGSVYYSKALSMDGSFFIFFVSQTQNKFVGLRFTNEQTLSYELHCEIDLSPYIANPAGLDIIQENGVWTALISNIASPFKLIRVIFDSDIQSITQSTDITSGLTLNIPFDIKILKSDGQFFAFMANSLAPASQQLLRLSFGTSLLNSPSVSYIGLPSGSQAASLDFYQSCTEWIGFVSSRNGKIFRMEFGSSLASSPVTTELALTAPLNDPGGLALVKDHGLFFLLIQSRNGVTYIGNMGISIKTNSVAVTSLGNFNSTSRDWDIEVFRVENMFKVITANFTNGSLGGLFSFQFTTSCPANISYSTGDSEQISFAQTGTYKVTLTVTGTSGVTQSLTKEIEIQNESAPNVSIESVEKWCVSSPISLEYVSDTPIATQLWDFGDGVGSASAPNPSYQYGSAGEYLISLSVTATNGCTNDLSRMVSILAPPITDFVLPSDPICTSNEFVFSNASMGDDAIQYEWQINDVFVSQETDLVYIFNTTGNKRVKLLASLPGCMAEIEKSIDDVLEGPIVDFSFFGLCQNEEVTFTNETVGSVSNYLWDFGDSQTTGDEHPTHTYSVPGAKTVSLTANSPNGCQNSKTKAVNIYSKPQTNFSLALPPFSCSGTPSQFTDTTPNPTDSNLSFWQWNFGDPDSGGQNSSNAQNPQHTYANAGVYDVSLVVGTNFGCETTLQKQVTIQKSPLAVISNTPACQDVPVDFSGSADVPIKSWTWQIGSSTYYFQNPTHLFPMTGDYNVLLNAVGTNDCISSRNKLISIAQPLSPDFVVQKNCVNQQTELTDVTISKGDPIVSRAWNFGEGNTGVGSPVVHSFQSTGSISIQLNVTTQEGCVYTGSKIVSIIPSPQADFEATPEIGVPPLQVQFINTSVGATQYLWTFNDPGNTTSSQPSPSFTFTEYGNHVVDLTVFNSQNCLSSTSKIIVAELPIIDVVLDDFSFTQSQQGTFVGVVTIRNKGNTPIDDLPLTIDLTGIQIQEIVQDPILPNSTATHTFNFRIIQTTKLGFVCVKAELEGDGYPADNELCSSSQEKTFVFSPYPNPNAGTVNIDWITVDETPVTITIYDALGKVQVDNVYASVSGLSRAIIDMENTQPGIYFVVFDSGDVRHTFRMVVE